MPRVTIIFFSPPKLTLERIGPETSRKMTLLDPKSIPLPRVILIHEIQY